MLVKRRHVVEKTTNVLKEDIFCKEVIIIFDLSFRHRDIGYLLFESSSSRRVSESVCIADTWKQILCVVHVVPEGTGIKI